MSKNVCHMIYLFMIIVFSVVYPDLFGSRTHVKKHVDAENLTCLPNRDCIA